MSTRLTQLLLGFSLLLNCFVLAGFVYRSWVVPPAPAHVAPPPGARPGPLEALSQELKLDDGQRQATRGLFEQYSAARQDRIGRIQKIREQMTAEVRKPEFDMAAIDPLVEHMSRLRAEQQKANLQAISELATQLRPEQRERLHKILAERFSGARRAGGGPNAGRPAQ
jgi:Spy/CpxP family protein refolding chaperone